MDALSVARAIEAEIQSCIGHARRQKDGGRLLGLLEAERIVQKEIRKVERTSDER